MVTVSGGRQRCPCPAYRSRSLIPAMSSQILIAMDDLETAVRFNATIERMLRPKRS